MSRTVHLTSWAYDKLWTFIDECKGEVGGFGFIEFDPVFDGFIWHETFVVPQEVSAASVDYDDESLGFALDKALDAGVLDNPHFSWCMWHSHGSMGAYWSTTDVKDQIETMRDKSGIGHLFSFVGNHKHEYRMRLDVFDSPSFGHMTDESVHIERLPIRRAEDQALDELHKHVRTKKYTQPLKKKSESQQALVTVEDDDIDDWYDDNGDLKDWEDIQRKYIEDLEAEGYIV